MCTDFSLLGFESGYPAWRYPEDLRISSQVEQEERCRNTSSNIPMLTFRRFFNLRDTLVHSRTISKATRLEQAMATSSDFQPCNAARCKTCRHFYYR
ncbi:hypothetical protein PoB_004107500 [Plakobranchus ocellatus]|uniref:Uncharacterized protein n=1 Tax=Plakobranchus ocellatus TaxID=259542 RepID=A0AAV4B4P3_9GAST|nr:hypothetical protein PoB_004107500 [Plakobranchus ocellatus]